MQVRRQARPSVGGGLAPDGKQSKARLKARLRQESLRTTDEVVSRAPLKLLNICFSLTESGASRIKFELEKAEIWLKC
jgi:hypothetical protein